MSPRYFPVLLLSAFALMAAAPDGKTIAYNGNGNGATSCDACHGAQFQGNPIIHAPAIAGLPAQFILSRLAHYKSPSGHNALMKQEASALSSAESQAVAAYLSGLQKS
jgi:cytochrome c553